MPKADDRVMRIAADLADSAAVEGGRQGRSAKQQLDHWTRVGRAVSSQYSASRRRVEAALAGDLAVNVLTPEESTVFNAEINAAIEEKVAQTNYAAEFAARGTPWVALNETGDIVEYQPDGTAVVLDEGHHARS
ncbi:hypothetical protein ACAG26_21575 [Mycobacterium sp. pUA109]|uniref:TA system antitoxin ParD family protein n=1 Tax=Mycobacterium sp. pUA109 TaxID=3238982 RepID=UPI00351BC29B